MFTFPPSGRLLPSLLLPALLLGSALLAACGDSGPSAAPPEGWIAASPTRWYAPGADTTAAFRDLSTLEAMGVARDDTELVRWTQEKLTQLYRTDPETVDSVFAADYLDELRAGLPSGDGYGPAAEAMVERIKTEFYQRYNASVYQPSETQFAIPDSLAGADGVITVQVYVNRDNVPTAVKLVEGTGTALDQMMMRRALDGTFTDAWVRETAGRSAGTEIPSWVRISSNYAR
jgi:hypothetical protein